MTTPTSSACSLNAHNQSQKQSTNIKNFAHSCHKQKEQNADGRQTKGQLAVRPFPPHRGVGQTLPLEPLEPL